MDLITKITDKDIGEEEIEMKSPTTRTAVRILLFDNNDRIAILHKKIKNEYKLIGGGVDEGESLEEALKRETLEESGCKCTDISYIGYLEEYRSKMNFYQKSHIYVGKVLENTNHLYLTTKEKEEGSELCWIEPKEALEIIKASYNKIKPSKYSNVYSTKFIVKREIAILDYFLNKYNREK